MSNVSLFITNAHSNFTDTGTLLDSEHQEILSVPHSLQDDVVVFRPEQTNVENLVTFRYSVSDNEIDEATIFITILPTTHPSKVTTSSNLQLQFEGYSVEDLSLIHI